MGYARWTLCPPECTTIQTLTKAKFDDERVKDRDDASDRETNANIFHHVTIDGARQTVRVFLRQIIRKRLYKDIGLARINQPIRGFLLQHPRCPGKTHIRSIHRRQQCSVIEYTNRFLNTRMEDAIKTLRTLQMGIQKYQNAIERYKDALGRCPSTRRFAHAITHDYQHEKHCSAITIT